MSSDMGRGRVWRVERKKLTRLRTVRPSDSATCTTPREADEWSIRDLTLDALGQA